MYNFWGFQGHICINVSFCAYLELSKGFCEKLYYENKIWEEARFVHKNTAFWEPKTGRSDLGFRFQLSDVSGDGELSSEISELGDGWWGSLPAWDCRRTEPFRCLLCLHRHLQQSAHFHPGVHVRWGFSALLRFHVIFMDWNAWFGLISFYLVLIWWWFMFYA